jgi:hypothetical protein
MLALAAMLLSLATFGAACGEDTGSPEEKAEVEAAIRRFIDFYNAGDVNGVLPLLTERYVQGTFGASKEEIVDELRETLGDPQQSVVSVSKIKVSGDEASALVTYKEGLVLLAEEQSLIKESGVWRFDDFVPIDAPIPEGMHTVRLTMTEYAYDFDAAAVPGVGAAFAFDVTNEGEFQHEIELSSAPEDLDLETALLGESLPDELEVVTYIGPFLKGEDGTIVFPDGLPAGRYVMLSLVPDADGVEDALHGMVAEFRVG